MKMSIFHASSVGRSSYLVLATYILQREIISYVFMPNLSDICFIRRV